MTGGTSVHAESVLYRTVDLVEAADIETHGLRLGPNTMSGKWFATTLEDAERWGRVLYGMLGSRGEPFKIISIQLPAALIDQMYYDPMLDGIGPAYFAAEVQLPILNAFGTISIGSTVYYPS